MLVFLIPVALLAGLTFGGSVLNLRSEPAPAANAVTESTAPADPGKASGAPAPARSLPSPAQGAARPADVAPSGR